MKIAIFLIIVGLAIALRMGWRPSRPNMPKINWSLVTGTIVLLLVAIGLQSCVSSYKKYKEDERMAATAEREKNRTNPPPARVIFQARQWTLKTYDIPPRGLTKYLYPGFQFFALGGDITVTTPDDKIIKSKPGSHRDLGLQPEGMYIFQSDPQGADRKVAIYNLW